MPYLALCVLSSILWVTALRNLTWVIQEGENSGLRSWLNLMRDTARHTDVWKLGAAPEGCPGPMCLIERECGLVARIVLGTS